MERSMDQTGLNEYLASIYFDSSHPGAYSGVDKLYRIVKKEGKDISKGEIQKWLRKQEVYVKHKPVQRKFKRARVIAPRKFYQFDADTISMTRYGKQNKGYKYILVMIDILSRFAWTSPLKTLTGTEMSQALKKDLIKKPDKFRSDSGSEFVNSKVKAYLKSHHVEQFQTLNEKKANYAERLIQTLKSKITKFMHHNQTFEWVSILPKVTASYNNTYHRSIKMTPFQALDTDDASLWEMQYNKNSKAEQKTSKQLFKFKDGDTVKLSFIRKVFDRIYDERWTDEYFSITGRTNKQNIALYTIKDWSNDPVQGTFYESELQKVDVAENVVYKIEKILKRRRNNGENQVLVKWQGWHKKFNSWIPESEIKDI